MWNFLGAAVSKNKKLFSLNLSQCEPFQENNEKNSEYESAINGIVEIITKNKVKIHGNKITEKKARKKKSA